MTERRILFPRIDPYQVGWLKVSPLHTLYYEQVGNPEGIPVVFLHGGPGVGAQKYFRGFFDPQRFRVIIFSQRGAGSSTPSGALEENTTWHLVEDIEKLRSHLGIERWFVFGGSWGSTLALAYAQTHPDRARGLVLRGVFLGTRAENRWLYGEGASRIFPELWEQFVSFIPKAERDNLAQAYYQRLTSPDRSVQMDAANHWYDWEENIIRLIPRETKRMQEDDLLAFSRIECHYTVNDMFFPEDNYLLKCIQSISHIPCWIAQGRYDVICPVTSAYQLHKLMPKSTLEVIPDAGHSISEPGLVDSLIRGIETLADLY